MCRLRSMADGGRRPCLVCDDLERARRSGRELRRVLCLWREVACPTGLLVPWPLKEAYNIADVRRFEHVFKAMLQLWVSWRTVCVGRIR